MDMESVYLNSHANQTSDVLKPLLALNWKQCCDLPVNGMGSAQAAFFGDTLYFGGGLTNDDVAPAVLYTYSLATDQWGKMKTPVRCGFAIVVYDHQLVLVGGVLGNGRVTNKLWTLIERDGGWFESLPPMKLKRYAASSVAYKEHLLVVGGEDNSDVIVSVTEVYNSIKNDWMSVDTISPRNYCVICHGMKSAVMGSTWYLMGGEEQNENVFFASLDSLISRCAQDFSESAWKCLPDVPYYNSSPAVLGNMLVAVGGGSSDSIPRSDIYGYSQDTKNWEHVGKLPEGVSDTCTIVLPTRELMVIGGSDSQYDYSNKVFISVLKDKKDAKESLKEAYDVIIKLETKNIENEIKLNTLESDKAELLRDNEKLYAENKQLMSQLLVKEKATWILSGVDVCGEKEVVVYSSQAREFEWKGFGLKLTIQKGSLPAGVEQCTINIKASLSGQYKFPEKTHLVSAIFWFRCEPMCKFTKPVTVEMQHCARSENVANHKLKFVRAVCSQKQLPYTFKELGGDFTSHSSYGVVEVKGFSGLAITQEGSSERNYLANLLFKEVKGRHTPIIMEIFFVVICNTDAHLTVMNNHTRFKDTTLESDQPIVFESDHVEFKVSKPTRNWKIAKINSAVVRKDDVDSFSLNETSWIPHSHFKAKFQGDVSTVADLECEVEVVGARKPHNQFTIDISPEGPIASPQWMPMSPSSVSSDYAVTKLTHRDHGSLLRQLSTHAAQWRNIGTALGFAQGEMDNIHSNTLLQPGSPTSWLSKMLSQWLEWAPCNARGSRDFATLEGLREALKAANLGATAHDLHL